MILNHKDAMYHLNGINVFQALIMYEKLQEHVKSGELKIAASCEGK